MTLLEQFSQQNKRNIYLLILHNTWCLLNVSIILSFFEITLMYAKIFSWCSSAFFSILTLYFAKLFKAKTVSSLYFLKLIFVDSRSFLRFAFSFSNRWSSKHTASFSDFKELNCSCKKTHFNPIPVGLLWFRAKTMQPIKRKWQAGIKLIPTWPE